MAVALLVVTGVAASFLFGPERATGPAVASADNAAGLEVIGEMPALTGNICVSHAGSAAVTKDGQAWGPCPMVVDPVRNLGFSFGQPTPNSQSVHFRVYDLARMAVAGEVVTCARACAFLGLMRGAVDSARGRLYLPSPQFVVGGDATTALPNVDGETVVKGPALEEPCAIMALDYAGLDFTKPFGPQAKRYDPCPEDRPFTTYGLQLTSDPPSVFLSGTVESEHIARQPGANFLNDSNDLPDYTGENVGQPLLVRQLPIDDSGNLSYGWDLDLRGAGCARRAQTTIFDPFVRPFATRVGDNLLAYCWDAKPVYWNGSAVGEQGYVVRIPLGPNGRPQAPDGTELAVSNAPYLSYRYVRTPTLPGYLSVQLDPVTGLLLLVTDGTLNGNAVWLFDPRTDRFAGVVTGGFGTQPRNNTMVGLDQARGRAYLLTQDGVLMVPARQRPLGGGLLFPVGVNERAFIESKSGLCALQPPEPLCVQRSGMQPRPDWSNHREMAVAPGIRRLFLPINLQLADGQPARYLVVQDRHPEAPPLAETDPDDNTTQVDERPGTTHADSRGQATASGVHAIAVGGVTRTVTQADPACRTDIPIDSSQSVSFQLEPNLFANARCATDQVVTPGHREVFLAKSEAEAGSGSGAVARGAGLAFGPSDVTTNDVHNAGQCGRGTTANVLRFDPGNPDGEGDNGFASGCNEIHQNVGDRGGPDLRTGTRGRDSRGFPLPAALCGDFGSSPQNDSRGGSPASGPQGALYAAATACNAAAVSSKSTAAAGAVTVPDAANPVLAIARTRSVVATAKTEADGQVTVAFATAEGVRIGPLAIREVKSLAITRAHGRRGTAEVDYIRVWCGVSMNETNQLDPDAIKGEGDCVNPDEDPSTQNFIAAFNQASPKARLTLPPANGPGRAGEASDGGFEAVLIKESGTQAGDRSVNDDDTHTVAGLEVIVYNDGPGGRNRYVVQLAGVHAESRYGILVLPRFLDNFDPPGADPAPARPQDPLGAVDGPAFDYGAGEPGGGVPDFFTPETFTSESVTVELLRTNADAPAPRIGPSPGPGAQRVIRVPVAILRGAIDLLVQHPREFALLFLVFSLLASPLYLGMRRRALVGRLVAST